MADYLVQPNRIERPTAVENAQNVMANSTIIEQGQQNVRTNQLRNALSPIFSDPNLSTDQKLKAITAKTGEFDQSAGLALMQAEQKNAQALKQATTEAKLGVFSKILTQALTQKDSKLANQVVGLASKDSDMASVLSSIAGQEIEISPGVKTTIQEGVGDDGKSYHYVVNTNEQTGKLAGIESTGLEVPKKEPTTKINIGGPSSPIAQTKDLVRDYAEKVAKTKEVYDAPIPGKEPAFVTTMANGVLGYEYKKPDPADMKKAAGNFMEYNNALALAKKMVELGVKPDPVTGLPVVGDLVSKFTKSDAFNEWLTQTADVMNAQIKDISGGAVTIDEMRRNLRAKASADATSLSQYFSKLNGFIDAKRSSTEGLYKVYEGKKGYVPFDKGLLIPNKRITYKDLYNEVNGTPASTAPAKAGVKSAPMEGKIYTDANGNRAIYRNGKYEEIK